MTSRRGNTALPFAPYSHPFFLYPSHSTVSNGGKVLREYFAPPLPAMSIPFPNSNTSRRSKLSTPGKGWCSRAPGWDAQPGGGCVGLITLPETHQRHSAPALCLSSKLPAKGGSAPALHLVSFYGNRKQLLVGDGDTQVKAGGAGGGKEPFIIFAPCTRLQHEAEMERRWGCFPPSPGAGSHCSSTWLEEKGSHPAWSSPVTRSCPGDGLKVLLCSKK